MSSAWHISDLERNRLMLLDGRHNLKTNFALQTHCHVLSLVPSCHLILFAIKWHSCLTDSIPSMTWPSSQYKPGMAHVVLRACCSCHILLSSLYLQGQTIPLIYIFNISAACRWLDQQARFSSGCLHACARRTSCIRRNLMAAVRP